MKLIDFPQLLKSDPSVEYALNQIYQDVGITGETINEQAENSIINAWKLF